MRTLRVLSLTVIALLLTLSMVPYVSISAPQRIYLRFSGWGAGATEIELYRKMLKEFMKENPEIYVKYEPIPQMYHENILAMFGAGVAPDVFYVDSSWAPIFISKGALLPIDKFAKPELIAQYYDFLLTPFKDAKGRLYGLPKDWSMLFLCYNKKLFAKAGITKPPDTWEELLKDAKLIADKTGIPGFMVYFRGFERYLPMALSYGAPKPFFAKPEDASWFKLPVVKETLKWWVELYTKGKIEREKKGLTPYVVSPADVGAGWFGDAFGSGKVAMVLSGNWIIPFLNYTYPDFKYGRDWDVAPVPRGPKGRATMAFTVCLGINAKTKHPEAAWKLVKFLIGKEGQEKLVVEMGHTLPSIKALAKSPKLWPQHRKTLEFQKTYDVIMVWYMGPKHGELTSKIGSVIEAAMLGKIPPGKVTDELYEVVYEVLKG